MRIQLIRIWLVLLLSLLISSIALADEDAVNTNASTNEEAGNTATNNTSNEQLFVLTSKWATLKPVNTKKGIYRLVLHGIAPYVSYYSNTPDLNTGMLSTATFVSQWQKGLKSKEPSIHQGQAGVRLHGILNKKSKLALLNLKNPVFDAKKQIITFTATANDHKAMPLPGHMMFFRQLVLFIDDVPGCWSCVIKKQSGNDEN